MRVPARAAAIRGVDDQLRAAIDTSPIGTVLLDDLGHICYVNDAAAAVLGVTVPDLIGTELAELVHPDDRSIADEELDALGAGAVPSITREWRVIPVSVAATRWVRSHLSVVPLGGDPTPPGGITRAAPRRARFLVQLEDITALRDLADELDRHGRLARFVLEALDQGVVLVDSTGYVHRMNRAAERLLGAGPEELFERWLSGAWAARDLEGNAIPPTDRPVARALLHGEHVVDEPMQWIRPDGGLAAVRMSARPGDHGLQLPAGVTAALVTFTDVTTEHEATAILDAVFATAPAGLALFQPGSPVVQRCNPTFAEQFGRSIEEIEGADALALIAEDERDALAASGARILAGEDPTARLEHRVVRPDGTIIWLEGTIARVDDLDSVVLATFDVTERRQLVQRLERFRRLFDQANDLITVVSADAEITYASPSHHRVLGLPADAGTDVFLEHVHPDDRSTAVEQVGRIVAGAPSAGPFEIRARSLAGDWLHLETVAVNLLQEPTVAGIVLTSRDVTDRVRLREQLEHRVAHDVLTELPNRALFEERLEQAMARAARSGDRVGLCFVDLDRFKWVNDTLGHTTGDRVLAQVADRLRGTVRIGDTPARLGGDEFVVILDPIADEAEALVVARRIHDGILDPPVVMVHGSPFGVSIGVAVSHPGESIDSLRVRADRALYVAKSAHTDAVMLAEPPGHLDDGSDVSS